MDYTILPAMNATLNGLATVLMLCGWVAIKQGKVRVHKRFMNAAGICSGLFLTFYVIYHFNVGSVPFKTQGTVRTIYLAILLSHVLLAVVNTYLVPRTFYLAWKHRDAEHKKLAKITFPLWLYVSITGVVIYMMLYRWFPNPI